MKKSLLIGLIVAGMCITGCGKRHEALEDMQQPMAPEDLSRLSNNVQQPAQGVPETRVVTDTTAPVPTASELTPEVKLDQLPPSGPYKPSTQEIQTALKNANFYTGAVDGKIGPMTKKAIEEFQKANNLEVDGKVGPKTWAALSRFVNLPPVTTAPETITSKTSRKKR